MSGSERDAGLERAVGPWALAASIANIVIGAGIFAVPASLAAAVGPYGPLAFLVCAIAVGSVALCFAEGGSRVPTSGGAYGYIAAAFGPFAAYVVGALMVLSDALACGGIAAALADVVVSAVPVVVRGAAHAAVILVVVGGIALVNTRGVARGARLVDAATLLKLAPLAVFVVVGATAIHRVNFVTTTAPSPSGLGRALILAFFACSGMEAALAASGEVRDPSRTIPRAIAGAMAAVTLLYMSIQVIAQGILGGDLARSKAPLADAMACVSPTLRVMMVVAAALSMFGWIGSDVLGTPRLVFAFARDGHLPSWLGRLHPRSHAPYVAILSYAAVAMALALTGTFAELAVLSTLAVAPLYVAGCLAAWRLRARGVALAGRPLSARGLGLAAAAGVASQVAMIALASRTEIAGLGIAMLGTSLLYGLSTRSSRSSASSLWK